MPKKTIKLPIWLRQLRRAEEEMILILRDKIVVAVSECSGIVDVNGSLWLETVLSSVDVATVLGVLGFEASEDCEVLVQHSKMKQDYFSVNMADIMGVVCLC